MLLTQRKQWLLFRPHGLYARPCRCSDLGVHHAGEIISTPAALTVCHDDYTCSVNRNTQKWSRAFRKTKLVRLRAGCKNAHTSCQQISSCRNLPWNESLDQHIVLLVSASMRWYLPCCEFKKRSLNHRNHATWNWFKVLSINNIAILTVFYQLNPDQNGTVTTLDLL